MVEFTSASWQIKGSLPNENKLLYLLLKKFSISLIIAPDVENSGLTLNIPRIICEYTIIHTIVYIRYSWMKKFSSWT